MMSLQSLNRILRLSAQWSKKYPSTIPGLEFQVTRQSGSHNFFLKGYQGTTSFTVLHKDSGLPIWTSSEVFPHLNLKQFPPYLQALEKAFRSLDFDWTLPQDKLLAVKPDSLERDMKHSLVREFAQLMPEGTGRTDIFPRSRYVPFRPS